LYVLLGTPKLSIDNTTLTSEKQIRDKLRLLEHHTHEVPILCVDRFCALTNQRVACRKHFLSLLPSFPFLPRKRKATEVNIHFQTPESALEGTCREWTRRNAPRNVAQTHIDFEPV